MSRTDKSNKGKTSGRQGGERKGSNARGNAPIKKDWQRFKKKEAPKTSKAEDGIRLNKYIANSGICSRREADIYIAAGSVWVNGKPITEMGYKVQLNDQVKFDGKVITPEKPVYLLLNKPKGFIASADVNTNKNVYELVANATKAAIKPVDKMERTATGLLLLTNDVELSAKLNSNTYENSKLYHVTVDKNISIADVKKIENGVHLGEQVVNVDEISFIDNGSKREVGLKISHEKHHVVKKIFETLGYEVVMMDRVLLNNLTKKDLPRGHWRFLTQQEIINIKNGK